MAKLRVVQTLDNNTRSFLFINETAALSQADRELVAKFGEPEINLGGTFTTDSVDWTLPDSFVKIVSGLPVRKDVDISVAPFVTNTTNRLATYRTTITSRFTTALTTLRANNDSFTNEYVTQV